MEIVGSNPVDSNISIGFKVIAHKAVRVFGFGFDIGRRGKGSCIPQQADGRLLLGLPAAETGRVLIATACLFFTGGQDDLQLPVRGILDGTDREVEIGFYSNIHCYRCLTKRWLLFSNVKIRFYFGNSDKMSIFAPKTRKMYPLANNTRSFYALENHCIKGTFFCTFSSKSATGHLSPNDYTQCTSEHFRRCSFTGKERDEETGYGYFGARYMDHELMTMWLSVDPMADKYPSMSPYAYCAWNPVKLVDPDGMDTIYYNLYGKQLFSKTGGDDVNMMVLTDKAKMDEEEFKARGVHSFDLATLNIGYLDEMYDYSDQNGDECYYAIRGDGSPTERQYGDEKHVSEALFDANDWQYNVHTHSKRDLMRRPNDVMSNTTPSEDKDMVGIGSKFGIILGYTRRSLDAGSIGRTFTNSESTKKTSFHYERYISFYDSKGRIGNSISYNDFKKTVKKIKSGK